MYFFDLSNCMLGSLKMSKQTRFDMFLLFLSDYKLLTGRIRLLYHQTDLRS